MLLRPQGKRRARDKGVKFGRKPSLSPEQLLELRMRFADNAPREQLAREFGIAPATVYRLCQHLTQPTVAPAPTPPHTRKSSRVLRKKSR